MNDSPASKEELTTAFNDIQSIISSCGPEQQPFASLLMRKEVAYELAKKLQASDPELFIAVVSSDPEDDYNLAQNCILKQFIVAKHKRTFDQAKSDAVDW